MEDNMINSDQGTTEDIYNYLVDSLQGSGAKIQKLDNGGIYVTNWKAQGNGYNELYIPPNIDSNNVSMISYLPGQNGSGSCATPLRDAIKSETPPECIITIAGNWDDRGNTMEAATSICSNNGLDITNVALQSYSMSGGIGIKKMELYLENHPNTEATYISADGYNFKSSDYTGNIDTLVENQIPIVLVNPSGDTRLSQDAKNLGALGLNMYIIETDRRGHSTINQDVINNGLLQYALGIEEELGGPYNSLAECQYKIYQFERLADGEKGSIDAIRNNAKYILIDDFSVFRQENDTYGYTLERLTSNPFDDGSVGADMYNVVTSLNSIRQTLGSQEVFIPTYTSTSTIPSNLMNAETSFLGISSELSGTIYKETQVISSIAQVFYDMDRERSNAASELSNGSFNEAEYTDVLNQLISYDITSEIQFDSFLFDPFSHTEGNSGKICLSDLTSMLSGSSLAGPLHDNLESERQSALAIQTEIDNLNTMISSGSNFKGDIWTAVGNRLTDYSDLMKLRIDSANILESAMARAIKLIVDYMGEYEELDDSKLPELKEKAEQVKQEILDAQAIVDATHNVKKSKEGTNGELTYYYVTEYVYSVAARKEARSYITSARILLLQINREINKLENLPIVLAEAEQIINDALSDIYGNYGKKVGTAVTGKTVAYIPPQNTNYVAPAYSNTEVFSTYSSVEGKVDEDVFMMSLGLQSLYATYEDYLNGVLKENNPMYNKDIEDNGIEPGESLNDKIFDEPEETDPNPEDISGTPDADKDTGGTPDDSKPETPSDTKPETPNDPKPETPSDPKPETPSDPKPETPSDPKPETPSDPKPETPSDPKPETPSDPKPETPSDPKPETPSDPKPETPSDPKPETPSDPKPETNVTPSQPSNPDGNSGATNPGNTVPDTPVEDIPPIVEIPDEPDTPIADAPVIEEPTVDKPVIDITPDYGNDNDNSSSGDGLNLTKALGISLGVGAAVGAAALGAHTVKKAKDNNIYED